MSKLYELKWHDKMLVKMSEKETMRAMDKAAILVRDYIKTHFTVPGSYRKYKKRKGRALTKSGRLRAGMKFHWSSRPGEPPSVDTGHLRAGIQREIVKEGKDIVGYVGALTGIKYALIHELGGPVKNFILPPRPYLRPGLAACKNKIKAIFKI